MRILLSLSLIALGLIGCDSDDDGGGGGGVTDRETYPSAKHGTEQGDVLANLKLQGGDGEEFEVSSIYFNTDNKVLLVTTSAGWCTACREEGPKLIDTYEAWHDKGLEILMAVFEDADYSPATPEYAVDWKARFNFPFIVVADPENVFKPYYPPDTVPMNMLVDVNTMEILAIMTSWDESVINAILENKL